MQLLRAWREQPITLLFFGSALAVGLWLRLSAPGLIEYKGDESWSFVTAQRVVHGADWPGVGMESSVGLPNPGPSLWIFVVLSWVSGARDPVALSRAVEWMNGAALLAIFLFAWTRAGPERALWLWTGALAAVNPLGVILQRKIWAQSTLPLIVWLMYLGWRFRHHFGGAFLWGLMTLVACEIHLSGFFFVPLFLLWAVYAHRRGLRRVAWWGWLSGSLVGVGPLIQWGLVIQWGDWFRRIRVPAVRDPGAFWRGWFQSLTGSDLHWSLGAANSRSLVAAFRPTGGPLSLVVMSESVTVAVGAVLGALLAWRLARRPREVMGRLVSEDVVSFCLALGYGAVMTVLPVTFFPHYLLVAFPFVSMTLPVLATLGGDRGSRLIAFVWIVQLVLIVATRAFLMAHHGAPGNDFGVAFQFQDRRF